MNLPAVKFRLNQTHLIGATERAFSVFEQTFPTLGLFDQAFADGHRIALEPKVMGRMRPTGDQQHNAVRYPRNRPGIDVGRRGDGVR